MWGRDPARGYSWTSITLHWLTAIGVFVLLFAGASIGGDSGSGAARLHISVGLTLYVVLWGRIAWRFICGHPAAATPAHPLAHAVGVWVHIAILGCLAIMLVTGPLTAAAVGAPLRVFGLFQLPAIMAPNPGAFAILLKIHGATAAVIAVLVTVHILGVMKHLMFDRDGVFDRIMIAGDDKGG